MTVEEMIEKLVMDARFMRVADRFARQDPLDAVAPIIAALRAGQEMRLTTQFNEDGYYAIDEPELLDACQAWDAATSENKS